MATPKNLALGCLIGGMVGDAAGAVLEFDLDVTMKKVNRAMKMPGGGPHCVAKGQFTDDSELDLALLHALVDSKNDSSKITSLASKRYIEWYKSDPFDCGQTTRQAFEKSAKYASKSSQANGALMRIAPLAVWAAAKNVPIEVVLELAAADAQLSHPHSNCIDANRAFVVAILHLLKTPQDSQGAIAAARKIQFIGTDVFAWISDAIKDIETDCLFHSGHVKHGIMLAFYHLNKRSDFKSAIEHTLLQGGDTDTNAKIVGNLMGAFHGLESMKRDPIIKRAIRKVMEFDCVEYNAKESRIGINRPETYKASNVLKLVKKLYKHKNLD